MDFNEKLQTLRKQKGLTQEELAEELYVSRTAISKWESGRGYPSIDSLKGIAKFFDITVDELLSSEEILSIAQEDNNKKSSQIRDLVFGLFDVISIMFFILPLFAERTNGAVNSVSLIALTQISSYLKLVYFFLVTLLIAFGILTLALQNCRNSFWLKIKSKASLILSVVGAIVFTITLQPYAATFLFIFSIIKVLVLLKK